MLLLGWVSVSPPMACCSVLLVLCSQPIGTLHYTSVESLWPYIHTYLCCLFCILTSWVMQNGGSSWCVITRRSKHLGSLLLRFTLSFYICFLPIMCALCLQYVKSNKEADNDWFRLESNKEGTKCVCLSVCLCLVMVVTRQ